jgi:transcriptional regulator with XRE-family HTH domain
MDVAERIKNIRKAKGLSQKEVITTIGMGSAQYSRIENGKTDPSVTTLEKIATALGVTLSELFAENDPLKEVNSTDRTLIEKVQMIEKLEEEEKKTIYTILDAFVSKQKLKNALTNALDLA